MRRRRLWLVFGVLAFCALACGHALATPVADMAGTVEINGEQVAFLRTGGDLPNNCTYEWWYGCSPTSAGMMMGYYDRNGYNSLTYDNLVPGGTAEANTFGDSGAIVNDIIASDGHVEDFWGSPDPLDSGRTLPSDFDCLADFMGTSQDGLGGGNGWTSFYYRTDGGKTYPSTVAGWGVQDSDGMYGVGEYVQYAGYNYTTNGLYSQLLPGVTIGNMTTPTPTGFTYADYKAEIDAGRPVMIQVEDHSMCGYGYVDGATAPTIKVYDTWDPNGQNPGTMAWGGDYGGRQHYGVMVLEVTGGDQPGPPPELEISWLGPNGPEHIEGIPCEWHEIWAHVDWPGHEGETFDIDAASVHWSISGGLDQVEFDSGIWDPKTVSQWFPWAEVHVDPDLPYCTTLAVDADIISQDLFGDASEHWSNIISVHVMPEPTTLTLLVGGGLLALVRRRWK